MKNKNEIAKIGGLIISVTLIILITLLCVINPPIYSTDILSNEEEYKFDDYYKVYLLDKKYDIIKCSGEMYE